MSISLSTGLLHRLLTASSHRQLFQPSLLRSITSSCVHRTKVEEPKRAMVKEPPAQPLAKIRQPMAPVVKSMVLKTEKSVKESEEDKKTGMEETGVEKTGVEKTGIVMTDKNWRKMFSDAVIRKQEAIDRKCEWLGATVLEKVPILERLIPSRDTELTLKMPTITMKSSYWLILSLIALVYSAVYLSWYYGIGMLIHQKDPSIVTLMMNHFTFRYENLKEGRWWTLFTSCFSHKDFFHYYMNNLALFVFGTNAIAILGGPRFLAVYITAGVVSGLTAILWRQFDMRYLHKDFYEKERKKGYMGLGASGSLYGILTSIACLTPHTAVRLFFIFPMPAYVLVGGIFAYDFVSAWTRPGRYIDSAGHVGGIIGGFLFWKIGVRGARFASISK